MEQLLSPPALRPKLHFSPQTGWMNDPNGLLYHQGLYHLFYQYDPDNVVPVSMHWGHAVSRDLIHWEEAPVALYPDENGTIYSGSMVVDESNVSGLGSEETPPLLALFTYHKESDAGYAQSQGIAYSCDQAVHFKKYPHNPILTYPNKDFRDPMVFFHKESQKWVMLLVAGRSVLFYASADLLQWQQVGHFLPEDTPAADSEIWECPCLFACDDPDGHKTWCLLVSVFTAEGERYGMRYFTGAFDGMTFIPETPWDDVRMLDAGWDYYAGAIFNGTEDRTIMMAWIGCWYYARKTPCAGFRGYMGLPRELYLAPSEKGAVLAQRFAPEVAALFSDAESYQEMEHLALPSGGCRICLTLPEVSQEICLHNETEALKLILDAEQKTLCFDRSPCGGHDFGEHEGRVFSLPYSGRGVLDLDMVLDCSSLELLADGGRGACTVQYFTQNPLTALTLEVAATRIEFYPAQEQSC